VVGERERRELEVFGFRDELLELGRAVEEAVLRVDVEVDELGVRHFGPLHSHSIVEGGFEETS
jgi:hypothetical protein